MKSYVTKAFRERYSKLPSHMRRSAARCYGMWKADPHHPGLQFRKVGSHRPVYSIRVGIGWRALGVMKDDAIIWFWIGSHADYDALIRNL